MKIVESYNVGAEKVQVLVNIEDENGEFRYHVQLPEITKPTSALLAEIKHRLITEVAIGSYEILDAKVLQNVKGRFRESAYKLIGKLMPGLPQDTKDYLISILMHEMLGLENIEYLLYDDALEEVVINSSAEPVRVYHKKYGWLITNIMISSENQILNYANIIARRVGRQITTLNPLLDAHLITGDRSNAVLFPVSSKGNTLTIRKFARDPWTVTDLINNKTCTPDIFALIWLALEYELNILISGGTASGKTSFLNVCMAFAPFNHRILSIEDSVLGNSAMIVKKNGEFIKTTVGEAIDKEIGKRGYVLYDGTEVAENDGSVEIFSMNKKGKIELAKPSSFIRHKVKKEMYNVKLSSGRSIAVTRDHSLFTLIDNNIVPIKTSKLDVGNFIATPRLIDYNGGDLTFDLTEHLDHFDDCMLVGKPIQKLLDKLVGKKIKFNCYRKTSSLPVRLFKQYGFRLSDDDKNSVKIFPKRSNKNGRVGIPLLMGFDEALACLTGMWLADGSYDKNSVIFSMGNGECNEIVKAYGNRYNIKAKLHSDGISLMLHSKVFKIFFNKCLGFNGDAYTKKVPAFVYNLKKNLIASLIKGYFSGDGTVKKNEVCCASASLELLKDMQTLLLVFGVLLRIGGLRKDKVYEASISDVKFLTLFKENIGFVHKEKNDRLVIVANRKGKESKDVIPLHKQSYLKLKHCAGKEFKEKYSYKYWKSWHGKYLGGNNIGRGNLQSIVEIIDKNSLSANETLEMNNVANLAFNDLIWDQIVSIEKFDYNGYVYDFSVPVNESFVCENIVAHNTRELQFPKFLYWAPMTVRQPNPEGKGEVCMYPGSLFVNGNGELCEISDYVEKKIRNGARKLKDNVVAANGDGDTILAGDPLNLRYGKEKIKVFSKITDRKFICNVVCEDGTKFSVTENTKLPVLTKNGSMALLNPFEIKKNGGFMPLYTKLDVKTDMQKINIFDIFDKKDIYACELRKEYLLLEKNLRKKYKLNELANICGLKRQSFNYYRKTGIISIYALKKLIRLSDYDLDWFENKIKYLKGRGANANKVKIPRVVDEDLAYFAGFVLAEKFINKNRIIITQKEKINYILEELVNKLFGINLRHKHGEYNKYGLFSSVISCLMRELFNATTSRNIGVPKIIMRSPENIISAFLGGYIDGDGSVRHNNVSMSSINKSIVTEFKYLLIRLGIMSSMYTGKYRGNNIYTLNITARKDLKKACSILKFRKKLNVQKAKLNLSSKFREGLLRNRIPAFMINYHLETLKTYLSKEERYNFYYRYAGDDDKTISRERLGELVSLLQGRVHTTEKEKHSLNALRKLSTDDLEYVKIRKVVIKKNVKNIPSYDITPEYSKYFVAGNGNFTLVEDTMLDLLVNSLRMRPDRIVMGEIRTQEQAEVLFEAMHTGHSVYATVHADSIGKTIARLVNPPINVPSNLLTAVNLNVVMYRDRRKGIRRVLQVGEFIAGEEERHTVNPNILYRFRPRDDMIVPHNQAIRLFEDLSMHTGLSYQQILDNLAEKVEVLKWMVKKNIRKVDEVGEVVRLYYSNPKLIPVLKNEN